MKTITMKNGFLRMSDALLVVKARAVANAMTGNAHFPAPSPTLAQVNDTINAYAVAVEKAVDRSLQAIAVKNQLKAQLVDQLHRLGRYVLYCAGDDMALAINSGFVISPPCSARPPLTAPGELVLIYGFNRGELLLKLKRVKNMHNYRYEITQCPLTPDSEWTGYVQNVSKNFIIGLVSGKEYACRVIAFGTNKQAVCSGVVTRIAL